MPIDKPLFPEYDQPIAALLQDAAYTFALAEHPYLEGIKIQRGGMAGQPVDVGKGRYHAPGPVEMSSQFEFEAVLQTDLEVWSTNAVIVGKQLGDAMAQMLFQLIDKSSTEAGTAVNSGGRPMSWDLFLDMLDRMEFDVDDENRPVGLKFVTSEVVMNQILALPPPTTEQNARYELIIEKKREAQLAKKRTRTLD